MLNRTYLSPPVYETHPILLWTIISLLMFISGLLFVSILPIYGINANNKYQIYKGHAKVENIKPIKNDINK